MATCLLFYLRYPEAGKVKSRLAADTSPELAAVFYNAFVADSLREILKTGLDVMVCYTPDKGLSDYKTWLADLVEGCTAGEECPAVDSNTFLYHEQRGKNIGERMYNGMLYAFQKGYDKVLVVGSDIPTLTSEDYLAGAEALEEHGVCIGPAEDGGYYMIGFQKEQWQGDVFSDIPWSTDRVLTKTVSCLCRHGKQPYLLKTRSDIDLWSDLQDQVFSEGIARESYTAKAYREYLAGKRALH
ncbi:MAG: TIGR04282 family arsenosugar biosynthesis glycosyltransferase [Desulfovibrio sp.]